MQTHFNMITATITRIEAMNNNTVVVVRFEGGAEPTEKHYIFKEDEEITKETIKVRSDVDKDQMELIAQKIADLQDLINQTL